MKSERVCVFTCGRCGSKIWVLEPGEKAKCMCGGLYIQEFEHGTKMTKLPCVEVKTHWTSSSEL